MKGLFLSATLFVSLSAFASELMSPVQLFDAVEWTKVRQEAIENPKIASLKLLIEINYDPFIGRPWEQKAYQEEYQLLWSEFRKNYCPSDLEICSVSEVIRSQEQVDTIRKNLTDSKEREKINQALAPSKMQLTGNLYFPGLTAEDDSKNFSLRVSRIEGSSEPKTVEVWEIPVKNVRQIVQNHSVVYDIASYASGFSMKPVPSYFALDSEANSYLQIEKLKMSAMEFAENWKRIVRSDVTYNAINTQELLLQKLRKQLEKDFQIQYSVVSKKLDAYKNTHQEDIERFQKERESGDYPLEVYQAVAYQELLKVAQKQAEFYQWAKKMHLPLDKQTTTLQGLLSAQKSENSVLLSYLTHRIAVVGAGAVYEQILNDKSGKVYLLEHVSAFLEQGLYENKGTFEKYAGKLDWQLILDEAFLKEHRPTLYEKLKKTDLLTVEKLKTTPLAIQRQVLIDYISEVKQTESGPVREVFVMGVLRLAGTLFLSLEAQDFSDFAEMIYLTRFTQGT